MYQVRRINIEEGRDISEYLMAEISAFTEEIRSRMDIDRIILYGSVARGDFNEGSDVDLLIVADFKERFHKRPLDIFDITDLPIEPVCYTRQEFEELVRNKNPFVLSVCEEGILV
ncbi:nucleotidyltransferase domain-containing protein [Methanogenium cariaci]|jgi:predicted nucleotidyltransferase